MESLKKIQIPTVSAEVSGNGLWAADVKAGNNNNNNNNNNNSSSTGNITSFRSDSDGTQQASEEGAGGDGDMNSAKELEVDPNKISISKTQAEKAQALAMHKLAGLQQGDKVTISREALPGATLFPAIKYESVNEGNEGAASPTPVSSTPSPTAHRFLVITRERFLVLDSDGGGVGSKATVEYNHHLTELTKMTFRKKDPELITLFFAGGGDSTDNARQYRVSKRKEFVEGLQKAMQRFK